MIHIEYKAKVPPWYALARGVVETVCAKLHIFSCLTKEIDKNLSVDPLGVITIRGDQIKK